jgi:penicillin-binding protein 1C
MLSLLLRKTARTVIAVAVILCLFFGLRFSPYAALDAFLARDCSARFYDRNGVLLQVQAVEDGVRREYAADIGVEDGDFPPLLRDIVVFSEDRRFFFHWGVDMAAAARAFVQNTQSGQTVSGASTITMQLARIIGGNRRQGWYENRNLAGKLAEAVNAARLEARFSKKELLVMYLNAAPFGGKTEGFVSAARTFFSKDLADLSPAEMFVLAVMPRRPALYNPLENPDVSAQAAAALYGRFAANRRLMRRYPELAALVPESFALAAENARRFSYPFEAPHFIRYMAGVLRNTEALQSGDGRKRIGEARLSLDLDAQRLAEGLLSGGVERYASSRLTNGAALAIDNRTGEILVWVGSADFFNEEHAGQIDGVLVRNQPGSSVKPFLYALALESGFLPTDVFADIPKNYGDTELYIPQNFNNRFNGPVLFRTALASSLNIPAVDLLFRLGFDSVQDSLDDAGLGLALGNAPVSLLELARAFSVFPNDGLLVDVSGVLGAEPLGRGVAEDQAEGGTTGARVWSEGGVPPTRVFDSVSENGFDHDKASVFAPDTARIIASMLSDRSARVLAFGPMTNFETPFPSMFKTGTANQYQSIVALGATPLFTVGVWMENFTGETVIGRTGSSIPAAIARNLLVFLQGRTTVPFRVPENWVRCPVCALSGMRAGSFCVSVMEEWGYAGSGDAADDVPVCDWHRADGSVTYPAEYQAWFLSSARRGGLDYHSSPLEVVSPREGFVFFAGQGAARDDLRAEIPVEVTGGADDTLVVDYDGAVWTENRPFVFFLPLERGDHWLTVRCGGEEATVRFRVE